MALETRLSWGVVVWGGGRGEGRGTFNYFSDVLMGGGVAAWTSPFRDSSHMPNLAHFTDDSLSFLRMLLFKMVIRYIYLYLSYECIISARPLANLSPTRLQLRAAKRAFCIANNDCKLASEKNAVATVLSLTLISSTDDTSFKDKLQVAVNH